MNIEQLNALVYQSLEHEMGGVRVYETAVRCALNDDLREEWEKYLEQTRNHVRRLQDVCTAFGLDPKVQTPGRGVVRTVGSALVEAMEKALTEGTPDEAQLVACEAVTIAETKDHLDWELLGKCAKQLTGPAGEALRAAWAEVEDEEDEHLYHTKGWCRELWLQSLGMPAVLPPPEEEHHVKTAIGAARAEQASDRKRRRSSSKEGGMATRKTASRKSTSRKTGARKSTAKTASRKTTARKGLAKKRGAKTGATKSASRAVAQKKVKKVMHERKAGTLRSGSGKKVTSRKQAIAIGLSEARKAGARIPRKSK